MKGRNIQKKTTRIELSTPQKEEETKLNVKKGATDPWEIRERRYKSGAMTESALGLSGG